MIDLPMIKSAAGWVIDVTLLDIGDLIVIKSDFWPHNFSSLDFKELGQIMYRDLAKGIYVAVVEYKPNQGLQIPQFNKPEIAVFKAITAKEGKS